MYDAYITAMNTQIVTSRMLNDISDNLMNVYTPGYIEKRFQFKTFLDGSIGSSFVNTDRQGKAIPGTADENAYIEGRGYFMLRDENGRISYTRLGDFKFDGDGAYRSKNGRYVQGYLLNEQGEIMNGVKASNMKELEGSVLSDNPLPAVNIKLWIDPSNGRYLGKYEEFEIKEDGILYGKADSGKICTPLYKLAAISFNNPQGLYQIDKGEFIETEDSGRALISNAKIKGKAIEQSNTDYDLATEWYQQAQFQLSIADKLSKSHRDLLEQVMGLLKAQ